MTSLHVICGLSLPQSKILGKPMNWRSPEKSFEDFFFGEHLRLCPWSLALASSVPVLGLERFCPRKGCPWPWPRIFFVSLALALASSLVSSTPPLMDIPPNLNSLLWYKQEEISHSRWLTTANGYLRMLLFHSSDLTVEKTKLSRLVSYIVSVY